MDPLQNLRILLGKAQLKTDFIDERLARLEKLLHKYGLILNQSVIDNFLKELSVENGIILTDEQNVRKAALVSKAYNLFVEKQGFNVITTMVDDLYAISGLNQEYFSELAGMAVNPEGIKKIVNARLGLNDKGELKREGFMYGLMDDSSVKNEISTFVLDKVMGGTGYEDLRSSLSEMIVGNPDKMGNFAQFYRNAAYDTYVRIDSLNGKLYADKLNLRYFIYAGTRRKASRHFCIHRKGKVFSDQEAEKWKDLIGTTVVNEKGKTVPAGPIVSGEDITTYNWAIDRGGYGCVDDIMWISEEIAFARRPDLKPAETPPPDPANAPSKETKNPVSKIALGVGIAAGAELLRGSDPPPDTVAEVTPKEKKKAADVIMPETHTHIGEYKNGGKYGVHKRADKGLDFVENVITARLYAELLGFIAEVNMHIHVPGVKNPELTINGVLADNKKPNHSDYDHGTEPYKSITSAISNSAKGAIRQRAIPVIILEKRYTLDEIIKGVKYAFEAVGKDGGQVNEIHLRYRQESITLISRKNFVDGDYIEKIKKGYREPL